MSADTEIDEDATTATSPAVKRSTPELRLASKSFQAGIVVLLVLAAVVYLTLKAQTGLPFRHTTTVRAYIDNVHSLRVNDDVRDMSKRVGRVSGISYADGKALVTMQLDGHVTLYRNATAAVWDVSALATKFVELDYGKPSSGPLGTTPIPSSQTQSSADLYQLLDVFDSTTRTRAAQTLKSVGGGLAGHGDDLNSFLGASPDLLVDVGTVSKTLAAPQTNLTGLLQQTNSLAGDLRTHSADLSSLVAQTDQLLDAVSVDDGAPLNATIEALPSTLGDLRTAMDAVRPALNDTGVAVRDLDPGAQALTASESDLRSFLVNAVPVAGRVPPVAQEAQPALVDLTGTLADARPLAPQVAQALDELAPPLQALAPYAPEMGSLFVRGSSFVSQGTSPTQRFARLGLAPNFTTVTNGLDGLLRYPQDDYPAPGQAVKDRAKSLAGLTLGDAK